MVYDMGGNIEKNALIIINKKKLGEKRKYVAKIVDIDGPLGMLHNGSMNGNNFGCLGFTT